MLLDLSGIKRLKMIKKYLQISLTFVAIILTLTFFSCEEDKQEIKIGAILPMTGDAAKYGKWMSQGMQLAVDEINSKGGIIGKDIELVIDDSQTQPTAAVNAMNRLVNVENISFVLTTLTSVCNALIPIAEKNQIILFANATLPGLTDKGDFIFRNVTNLASDIPAMVRFLVNAKNKPRVGVIWRNDEFGLWGSSHFKELYEGFDGFVVSVAYNPQINDFRTHILRLAESKPDFIYLLGYSESGRIIKQAKELGQDWKFVGITTLGDPEVKKIAGEALDGAVFTEPAFSPDADIANLKKYQKKYQARFGEKSEIWAATFYDAVKLVALAIKNAESVEPEAVKNELQKISGFDGVTGITTFLTNGDVEKPVDLKIIEGGEPKKLEDSYAKKNN